MKQSVLAARLERRTRLDDARGTRSLCLSGRSTCLEGKGDLDLLLSVKYYQVSLVNKTWFVLKKTSPFSSIGPL